MTSHSGGFRGGDAHIPTRWERRVWKTCEAAFEFQVELDRRIHWRQSTHGPGKDSDPVGPWRRAFGRKLWENHLQRQIGLVCKGS